jgi:hypothetical protein
MIFSTVADPDTKFTAWKPIRFLTSSVEHLKANLHLRDTPTSKRYSTWTPTRCSCCTYVIHLPAKATLVHLNFGRTPRLQSDYSYILSTTTATRYNYNMKYNYKRSVTLLENCLCLCSQTNPASKWARSSRT